MVVVTRCTELTCMVTWTGFEGVIGGRTTVPDARGRHMGVAGKDRGRHPVPHFTGLGTVRAVHLERRSPAHYSNMVREISEYNTTHLLNDVTS